MARLKALQEFIIREIFKDAPTGVMRTLPNKELIDMNVQVLAQRLMQGGIDPTALKNANQVENAINMIESRAPVQQGIKSTKSAKVFDMEGQEIPQGSRIIGGKAVKETEAEIAARMSKENKEAAERIRKQKESTTSLDDEIKQAYDKAVKEDKFKNVRLRDGRKIESEEDFREYIDELNEDSNFAQGGRAGFANGSEGIMSLDEGAPSILLRPRASGMKREQQIAPGINLSERDISYGISGILQGDKFYGGASLDKGKVKLDVETEDGQTLFKDTIAKDDALNFILGMGDPKGEKDKFQIKFDDDLENMSLILKKSFAEGGRANFEKGGMSRRQFMKIMGGIASLPFIGKFFKGAKPAAKVAEVATKTPVTKPPEYFFDLAAKIKILGKESKVSPRERVREIDYKNYTLEEDLTTGDMTIVKRKGDPEFGYEEEVMALRKGQADETTKGRTPPDEYEEVTVRPDPDGKMKDVEDGIEPESVKEIMEEVGQGGGNLDQTTLEEIARGRLASGGVAMMLGE